MEGRISKVAWPGISQGGGNAQGEVEGELRELLDEFGIALEDEANDAGVNILLFLYSGNLILYQLLLQTVFSTLFRRASGGCLSKSGETSATKQISPISKV
jgi:hypothetical protein